MPITLVQAVLKGEKMDDVVRDAAMLGVAAIQPVVTKRAETTIAALLRGGRVDRWRRVALASAKQSRRAVVPEIRMPLTLETFLDEPPPALRLMLVEPGVGGGRSRSSALREPIGRHRCRRSRRARRRVDAEECDGARARGVRLVTLGHRTLRADAVPVAAISVLQFLCGCDPEPAARATAVSRLAGRTCKPRRQLIDRGRRMPIRVLCS